MVQEAQSSQQTAEVKKQRTRLATAKQRVSELEVLLCKIYEDNILGKLSDSRYATLDAQYAKEQAELTAEISALEKAVKSYETHEKDADRFIALIDKYENFDKLTIAIAHFAPAGILLGSAFPKPCLCGLRRWKIPQNNFSDFSKTVPLYTLFFSY